MTSLKIIKNYSLVIPMVILIPYIGLYGFWACVRNFFLIILFFLGFLAIISIGWYYSWKNIL